MSILGTRVRRVEDPALLTVGGTYTADVVDERLTGALHAVFVRSPVAHARVLGIDTSAALEHPGVVAVYTAADVDLAPLPVMTSRFNEQMAQPILAGDTVRHVGDPVAVVVCSDEYVREDAVELVDVDYDPLPAVVDLSDALRDETVLFPEAGTNVVVTYGTTDDLDPHAFDECEVVVTRTIVNQRVAPAPMETRGAAMVWPEGDRLTAWIPSQAAQGFQGGLARALGVSRADVHVITPEVGGAFGARFGVERETALLGWLARETRRPIRWTETRYDNMLAMTHGRAQRQTVTIGGRRDGTMQAYRLEILQDCGAYPKIGALLPTLTKLMAPGTYRFDKVEAIATALVTNTTPIGAYRGAGRPEATAALERAVDLFAAEVGMDPAEVRRENLLPKFDEPYTNEFGAVYDTGDYGRALETALDAAGYADLRAEQARRRDAGEVRALGIGLACYVEITGGGDEAGPPSENATLQVREDGTATVLTGTSPHGQGHATTWAMLASDRLGIPVEKITVQYGDTDLVPRGGGTGGSRSLQQGGAAVLQAADELLVKARALAADRLEVAETDLRYDVNSSSFGVIGVPDVALPLTDLAADDELLVSTVFTAPDATFPFGAHVAVVEVDTETGKTTLERIVCVDDAGVIVNPLLAEGQRHGGIAQGAAQAFLEEVVYDSDGNPLTASFADYPFLSATEVPSFELVDMATPTTYNPLGAKGIGEAGSIGATPAVQNAVVDALSHLGVRHVDLPTSPRAIWRAISEVAR